MFVFTMSTGANGVVLTGSRAPHSARLTMLTALHPEEGCATATPTTTAATRRQNIVS